MSEDIQSFYIDDDVTLRVEVEINGVAQTPDAGSALIKIIKRPGGDVVLAQTAASISSTILYYKWTDVTVGRYRAFFTAKFNSGEDERTGYIDFNVDNKGK